MAKSEKTTPARRTAKIFIVEAAHVAFIQEVNEKTASSSSIRRDREDPEAVSNSVGARRLRDEFDAIWHGR